LFDAYARHYGRGVIATAGATLVGHDFHSIQFDAFLYYESISMASNRHQDPRTLLHVWLFELLRFSPLLLVPTRNKGQNIKRYRGLLSRVELDLAETK
jgi:hypothetical protein